MYIAANIAGKYTQSSRGPLTRRITARKWASPAHPASLRHPQAARPSFCGLVHAWRAGAFKLALDDPNADTASVVLGINNAGDIVGYYEDGQGFHGFLAYPAF